MSKCECGRELPCSLHTPDPKVGEAIRALQALKQDQRGLVLCWFCSTCHNYIGPGDKFCHQPT